MTDACHCGISKNSNNIVNKSIVIIHDVSVCRSFEWDCFRLRSQFETPDACRRRLVDLEDEPRVRVRQT